LPHPSTRRTAGPRRGSLLLLLGALALIALCLPGFYQPTALAATTFNINSTGDGADNNLSDNVCNDGSGNCTLRAAIQQANATAGLDTITFSVNGTINLSGALPDISTSMTISGPGSGLLTVRRDTGGAYRIFRVTSGTTVGISGLTVSNGKTVDGAPASTFASSGEGGGGISNAGTLTLTGCVITGNATGNGGAGGGGLSNGYGGSGGPGGGVYNTGTLKMTDCTVTSNHTGDGGPGTYSDGGGGGGGGIGNYQGAVTLTNCVISGNNTGTGPTGGARGYGGPGGGIYSDAGSLNIAGTVISNNVTGSGFGGGGSGGSGGGLYSGGATSVGTASVLTNVTVQDNRTGDGSSSSGQGGFGGGIFNSGQMRVRGLTVSGNVAGKSSNFGGGVGGGIDNSGGLDLANATISGNSTTGAGGTGGGLWNAGTAYVTNSTIAFNTSAGGFGGAGIHIYNDFYKVIIRNSIVARNGSANATTMPDVYGQTFTSQGYNLIGNADGVAAFSSSNYDQFGTTASPLDPQLAPLADNGGPTLTHALLASSPAIDSGSNPLAQDSNGSPLVTDQRGAARIDSTSHLVDRGAFEYHSSLEAVTDKGTNEDVTLSFTFAVGDGANAATSITAASNNQALLPDAGLVVSGSGRVRTLQLTPAPNQSGSAQITLSVTYAGGSVSTDTFQLAVTPVNDAPSFTKGADQTVAEDAGPQTVAGWATDITPGPNESAQAVSFQVTGNTNASLFSTAPAVSPSGTLTYTSAPNANGSATITLIAKDDGGTANGGQDTSAAQTFTITVTPVNDPPVAQNLSIGTSEDSSTSIFFSATDVEGNSITFTVVTNPSHGTLSGSGSFRTYTPALNYNGPDSFTYKATDSAGADSQPATVTINVTAVNDPPVNTFPVATQTTDQNTPLVFSAANSNAISVADVDAGTDPLRVTLSVTNGTLTLGGTANLSFTAGDGTDDATMTFAGTIGDLNAALNGLAFKPAPAFSGGTSLQVTTNDQGFNGAGGARTDTDFVNISVRPGSIEFKQSSYTAAEGSGGLAVVVKRAGDTSTPASVAYATDDGSIPSVSVPCSATTGAALDRCDFTKALGRLVFAPGETEKTITVLVGDDSFVEGTETAVIRLSGVSGTGVVLGARTVATLEITDDAQESSGNPNDNTNRFVRQHYQDFLNREPDASGLAFWTNEIEQCGADQQCREVKRINVSAAFFLSIEFQQTGFLVYRLDKVAFGNISVAKPVPLTLTEFLSDTQSIGQGLVVGAVGWEQKLEENKRAFVDAFVLRSRFTTRYPTATTPESYVDSLNANAGGVLSQAERDGLVADLKSAAKTRAQVLRAVAEHPSEVRRESNNAFVLMQYFGYLRRDPDSAPDTNFNGYSFWLGKLSEFNGNYIQAEMVKAFLTSDEYRKRFGQ